MTKMESGYILKSNHLIGSKMLDKTSIKFIAVFVLVLIVSIVVMAVTQVLGA